MIARAEGDADRMEIRNAGMDDLEKIAEVEALCFPKEEAATREELKERLDVYKRQAIPCRPMRQYGMQKRLF